MKKLLPKQILFSVATAISILLLSNFSPKMVHANVYSPEGVDVATTYYGGHYDNGWVIDNDNQCTRIRNGEFTAESLNARLGDKCDDDNGIGYYGGVPLHNRVSFAELSNNPDSGKPDWSALGGLPGGTRVEIKYKGRCLIAEKLDVGTGGYGYQGKKRALDLWWQTARSIGFTSGLDIMNIRVVDKSAPLTPLGSSYACQTVPQQKLTVSPTSTPTSKPTAIITKKPSPTPTITMSPTSTSTPTPLPEPTVTNTPTMVISQDVFGDQIVSSSQTESPKKVRMVIIIISLIITNIFLGTLSYLKLYKGETYNRLIKKVTRR